MQPRVAGLQAFLLTSFMSIWMKACLYFLETSISKETFNLSMV